MSLLNGLISALQTVKALRQFAISVFIISFLIVTFFTSTATRAATLVYIQNDTNDEVQVADLRVDGDPLSKKAWKKGKDIIPPGQRISVLSINRTGKFNWMDPTPRFIEPGKTAVFTVQLSRVGSDKLLEIKQKLIGTGSGSKLWYTIDHSGSSPDWKLPFGEISGTWPASEPGGLQYVYRALETESDEILELIIGQQ